MHLAGAVAFLVVAGVLFWFFTRDRGDRLAGNPFSASQYQQSYIGMRGNKYVVNGTILKQLRYRESVRLFSLSVKDEGASEALPVPVLVPAKFSSMNIQVGQAFQMSVLVDKDGVLKAEDIRKS